MCDVFTWKNLVNPMCQTSNLEQLFCVSKFISIQPQLKVNSCGKNSARCPF